MTQRQWLEILFLTTCSTFITMFTWTHPSEKLPATTTGRFLYLIPVIAVSRRCAHPGRDADLVDHARRPVRHLWGSPSPCSGRDCHGSGTSRTRFDPSVERPVLRRRRCPSANRPCLGRVLISGRRVTAPVREASKCGSR
jgi:hypothetical protein